MKRLILLAFALAGITSFAANPAGSFGLNENVSIIRARTSPGPSDQAGAPVKVGLRDDAGAAVWVNFEGNDDSRGHRGQFQVTASEASRYLEPNGKEEKALILLIQSAAVKSFGTALPEKLTPAQLDDDADYSRLALASFFSSMGSRGVKLPPEPAKAAPVIHEKFTVQSLLGGQENLELLTGATDLQMFRIVAHLPASKRKNAQTIDGFPCDSHFVPIAGDTARNALMAFSEIEDFTGGTNGNFDPEMILRFVAGSGTLDLAISFRNSEMKLFRDGKEVSHESPRVSFAGNARQSFLALAKAAFPNDHDIAGLKE